jgi:hypothetical protein
MIYTAEEHDIDGVTTITTWNVDTSTVTITVDGDVIEQRPMTSEEEEFWQRHVAEEMASPSVIVNGLAREYATKQNVDDAPPWAQPTGAHDAYLPGAIVAHNTKKWRNDLPSANVWEPGTQNAGWFDLTPPSEGPQPWVQPQGAHDAYNVGDQVTHNGQTWISTVAANVWEPGVYGWEVV